MIHKELVNEIFKHHKATLLTDSSDIFSIIWKNPETGDYYIKYIVDKMTGTLIIQGDCGFAVATWQSPKDPYTINNLISDIPYFASKLKCSTDKYRYDEKDIHSDLKEAFAEIRKEILEERQEEFQSDYFKICEMITLCQEGNVKFPDELCELLHKYKNYWFEDSLIVHAGRRLSDRIYLWAYGFKMAMEQIKKLQKANQ